VRDWPRGRRAAARRAAIWGEPNSSLAAWFSSRYRHETGHELDGARVSIATEDRHRSVRDCGGTVPIVEMARFNSRPWNAPFFRVRLLIMSAHNRTCHSDI
jgi:hypothetical protein